MQGPIHGATCKLLQRGSTSSTAVDLLFFNIPCADYGALERAVDSTCQHMWLAMKLIASATIIRPLQPLT